MFGYKFGFGDLIPYHRPVRAQSFRHSNAITLYRGLTCVMDIFNRSPSISEDTLQYALYPPPQSSDKDSVTSLAACLLEFVDGLLKFFIWHRDAFELRTVEDSETTGWFLEGRMRVGDSVDDEWCTVWLLREISSKWDLIIRYVAISISSIRPC